MGGEYALKYLCYKQLSCKIVKMSLVDKELRGPLGKIHSLVWGRRNRFSSYFAYELDFGQY